MALTRVLGAAFRAFPTISQLPQPRLVVGAISTMLQQQQQRSVVRAFSTTLSRPKEPEEDHPKGLVRAPIQVFGREGAYAHALYSAAVKENVLDTVEGDLKRISDFIEKVWMIENILVSPSSHPPPSGPKSIIAFLHIVAPRFRLRKDPFDFAEGKA